MPKWSPPTTLPCQRTRSMQPSKISDFGDPMTEGPPGNSCSGPVPLQTRFVRTALPRSSCTPWTESGCTLPWGAFSNDLREPSVRSEIHRSSDGGMTTTNVTPATSAQLLGRPALAVSLGRYAVRRYPLLCLSRRGPLQIYRWRLHLVRARSRYPFPGSRACLPHHG